MNKFDAIQAMRYGRIVRNVKSGHLLIYVNGWIQYITGPDAGQSAPMNCMPWEEDLFEDVTDKVNELFGLGCFLSNIEIMLAEAGNLELAS